MNVLIICSVEKEKSFKNSDEFRRFSLPMKKMSKKMTIWFQMQIQMHNENWGEKNPGKTIILQIMQHSIISIKMNVCADKNSVNTPISSRIVFRVLAKRKKKVNWM